MSYVVDGHLWLGRAGWLEIPNLGTNWLTWSEHWLATAIQSLKGLTLRALYNRLVTSYICPVHTSMDMLGKINETVNIVHDEMHLRASYQEYV